MIELNIPFFDISKIARSGQCFRLSEPEPGSFAILARDKYLRAEQEGSICRFYCSDEDFEGFWRGYFDLDTDYGAFEAAVDPEDGYLSAAVASASGMRILRQDLWEMIVTFLISQQNNIPRIRKCIENISREYGRPMTAPDGTQYFAFPEPEALAGLAEDALMPCNLGYRSKYVVRTARQIVEGIFDPEELRGLPYEKARQKLLTLYGVGSKVADCICLFALHLVDAFPIDTHIKQVLDKYYADGFPYGRYEGFAGIIQQYIFYYEVEGEKV